MCAISSFYLELRVAKYAEGESSIIYDIDVKRVFCGISIGYRIWRTNARPKGDFRIILSPCSTDAQLDDAKSKLATALARAQKARDAEGQG